MNLPKRKESTSLHKDLCAKTYSNLICKCQKLDPDFDKIVILRHWSAIFLVSCLPEQNILCL